MAGRQSTPGLGLNNKHGIGAESSLPLRRCRHGTPYVPDAACLFVVLLVVVIRLANFHIRPAKAKGGNKTSPAVLLINITTHSKTYCHERARLHSRQNRSPNLFARLSVFDSVGRVTNV
eukprot:7088297-Pyramimonas_sp.AAC.1